MSRKGIAFVAGLALVAIAAAAYMYSVALRDPVVRTATVALLPAGAAPLRVALMADIHVAGPDMPPRRLAKIVAQVNALSPDLVLIAGDLVSDKRVATKLYAAGEAVRPLAALDAPLVFMAVPGNHDHWRGIEAFERAFSQAGIRFLRNETEPAGPLVIAGVDDEFSGHADVECTFGQASASPMLVLTHSPDVIPRLPPEPRLVFAGHTHCGQIRFPVVGAPAYMSKYGDRFSCGHIVEDGRDIFVSAGLGTSLLPFRLGAVPDVWLVQLTARKD
ncbi:MAG: metallophosphoesterase [Pseudomonadota bacterium]